MCMLDKIHARRDEIRAIARKHKAERLWVFGSVARKEELPESDIDLVAEFLPGTSLLAHARLEDDLSRFFGCGVDVVSSKAIDAGSRFAEEFAKDKVAV